PLSPTGPFPRGLAVASQVATGRGQPRPRPGNAPLTRSGTKGTNPARGGGGAAMSPDGDAPLLALRERGAAPLLHRAADYVGNLLVPVLGGVGLRHPDLERLDRRLVKHNPVLDHPFRLQLPALHWLRPVVFGARERNLAQVVFVRLPL